MSTPTRLNINNDPKNECSKYNVFLDGEPQQDCEVADVEKGYVIKQRKHPLFKTLMLDRNRNVITRRFNGVVRIERKTA